MVISPAPAIMLLLYWIVRFAGTTENTDIHLVTFFAWTFAVSFSIAMIITLYVAHLCKTVQWE